MDGAATPPGGAGSGAAGPIDWISGFAGPEAGAWFARVADGARTLGEMAAATGLDRIAGPEAVGVAGLACALVALLARARIAALACLAIACAAWMIGEGLAAAPAAALILLASLALVSLAALRERRRVRAVERERDEIAQRVRALQNEARKERFWRLASGDERPILPDDEIIAIAHAIVETDPEPPGQRAASRPAELPASPSLRLAS